MYRGTDLDLRTNGKNLCHLSISLRASSKGTIKRRTINKKVDNTLANPSSTSTLSFTRPSMTTSRRTISTSTSSSSLYTNNSSTLNSTSNTTMITNSNTKIDVENEMEAIKHFGRSLLLG
jgi:hypothetical protein